MHRGSRVVHPATVSIRIGAPVETKDLPLDARDRVIEDLRTRIANLLKEGPVPSRPS
jgi:hypothetical protein